MSELREHIDYIVNSGKVAICDHPAQIAKFAIPHSIRHVDSPRQYNCFQYALGLEKSGRITSLLIRDAREGGRYGLKFGTEFILRLMESGLLREDADGRIVFYFLGNQPAHAGRLESADRVISKWGVGHLWEHGLWEVPLSYGDNIKLFRCSPGAEVESEFERYYEELRTRK